MRIKCSYLIRLGRITLESISVFVRINLIDQLLAAYAVPVPCTWLEMIDRDSMKCAGIVSAA